MKPFYALALLTICPLSAGEIPAPLAETAPLSGEKSRLFDGSKSALIPPPAAPSPWQFRTGIAWRRIGKTSVNPNLQNGANAAAFTQLPTGIGTTTGIADRTYDDGFVNIGQGTAASGLTGNWGYQNTSQIVGDSLQFTRSGGTSLEFPGGGSDGADSSVAPYLELAYIQPVNQRLSAGFSANFSYTGIENTINSSLTESTIQTVDTFNLQGVIPPQAPFVGTFDNRNPLIGNTPDSRDQQITAIGTRNFLFETDAEVYSLAFGGEVVLRSTDEVTFTFGAGTVLNYVDWDASFSLDTTSLGRLSDSADGDEFLWGFYLKAGMNYQIDHNWGLNLFYRYDWNETLTGRVGPAEFETDLNGWTIGGGVSYRF